MKNNLIYKILYVVGIGLIILSGVMAVQIYYNEKKATCISNPLIYAATQYEEITGYRFMGSGYFVPEEGQINSPKISFSSDGVDVSYPDNSNNFNLSIFTTDKS